MVITEIVNNIIYTSLFAFGVSMVIMIIEIITSSEPIKKPYGVWLYSLSTIATLSIIILCIAIPWRIWL